MKHVSTIERMSNIEEMDEKEMIMLAIAMSLEGEKEEAFSIKGELLKCSRNDGNQSELTLAGDTEEKTHASLPPSDDDDDDEEEEQMLKRAIAMSLE